MTWTALSLEVAVMFQHIEGGNRGMHTWDSACEAGRVRAIEGAREWRKGNRERQRNAVAKTMAREKARAAIDPAFAAMLRADDQERQRRYRQRYPAKVLAHNRRTSAARVARDKLTKGLTPTPYQLAMLAEVNANKVRTQTPKRRVSIDYQRRTSRNIL